MLRVFRCENDLAITLDLQHCGCRSSLQQCCLTRHLAAWIKPRHMSMSRPCPLRAWMAPHHLLVCMGDMLEVCDVFVNCHRTENGYNINFFVTNKISSIDVFGHFVTEVQTWHSVFDEPKFTTEFLVWRRWSSQWQKSFVTEAMISTSGLALSLKFNNVPTDYNPLVSLIMFRW